MIQTGAGTIWSAATMMRIRYRLCRYDMYSISYTCTVMTYGFKIKNFGYQQQVECFVLIYTNPTNTSAEAKCSPVYCVPFLCPRHSKIGRGALSVTPVRACVCVFVRACVRPLSKFGVRSITFERLYHFNSNLVCWYIISKHRLSSIWVTIH